jgi:hypothetical protein
LYELAVEATRDDARPLSPHWSQYDFHSQRLFVWLKPTIGHLLCCRWLLV